MRLLLVIDTYPPARISGALQMRDLAQALAAQGYRPLVLTPALDGVERLESEGDVQVLRVRALRTKDVPYWRRALAELVLPWILLRGLRRSALGNEHWDGVVWYSPTIFLGPLVRAVKHRQRCRSYLILRDLFPDWASDAGVIRKNGLPYHFFKWIERFQYRQADVIGVQTPSNALRIAKDVPATTRVEVLHNWLAAPVLHGGGEDISIGALEGRTIFVYAGNMGVAQDMDAFVDLARRMSSRTDIGFLFIGRGSEARRLQEEARNLPNLVVTDEIAPEALPALLARCHVGIVALHPAHSTHNIPGKLLTYLYSGLPVLARVNPNNDLISFVEKEGVGLVVAGDDQDRLHAYALKLADEPIIRARMGQAGVALAHRIFSPSSAALQLVESLIVDRRDIHKSRGVL